MKANWIKQVTATTGTGTMTLGSASAGFIALANRSDTIPDGAQVRYSIEDGNNREEGIGVYTVSGTTLSRATVIETLVAGVYDNAAPAPINLSGSAVVSINPSANASFDAVGQQHDSGYICFPDNILRQESSKATPTANSLRLFHGYLHFPRMITKLGFRVHTADAGATDSRCGIWLPNSAAEPGKLLYGTGNLSVAATGDVFETLSTPIYLPAGIYIFGAKTDSTTVRLTTIGRDAVVGSPVGYSSSTYKYRPYASTVVGALASDPSVTLSTASSWPACGWQS